MKTIIRRLLLTAAACLLLGHASAFAEGPITEVSQLNDPKMTIGVDQGSVVEIIVKNELPEAILSVKELPMTASGKPDKQRIREVLLAWRNS